MRRLSAALAVTAATLLLAASAGAATNHALRATIRSNIVAGSGNNLLVAGVVNSAALGEGGTVARLHVTSSTRSTATFTIWYGRGSFHGTATYTRRARPGGGINVTGTARVTGGTGRFAGATGRFTITGTQFTSGRSTQVATGNLRY
jgi:hypothetical protein